MYTDFCYADMTSSWQLMVHAKETIYSKWRVTLVHMSAQKILTHWVLLTHGTYELLSKQPHLPTKEQFLYMLASRRCATVLNVELALINTHMSFTLLTLAFCFDIFFDKKELCKTMQIYLRKKVHPWPQQTSEETLRLQSPNIAAKCWALGRR